MCDVTADTASTIPARGSVVVRTDFSDPERWRAAIAAMSTPSEPDGFLAYVTFVDDPAFADMAPDQVLGRTHGQNDCLFVADRAALLDDQWPVLYLELHGPDRGRSFRVVASELWSVENNLSLSNMDFAEFADATDPDGVYRGF